MAKVGNKPRPICALPGCNLPVSRGSRHWNKCCSPEHAVERALQAANSTRRMVDVELLRRLAAEGLSASEIGDKMGFDGDTIRAAVKRHDITLEKFRHYQAADFWAENDTLVDLLRAERLSLSKIARRIGVSKSALAGRLYRRGLCEPGGNHDDSEFWMIHDEERIAWIEAGVTQSEIADRLGITRAAVNSRIRRIKQRNWSPIPRPRIEFPAHGHCQFLHGEVGDADFGFCGLRAEPGSSWCLAHHRVVFRPAAPLDALEAA